MTDTYKDPILERYTVVKTDSDQIPYELHGARGARYGLMRNVPKPENLFAINLRNTGVRVIDRLGWFTDEGGVLRSDRARKVEA